VSRAALAFVLLLAAGSGCMNGDVPITFTVAWRHAAGCAAGQPTQVMITVTVDDRDVPPDQVTVQGSVQGCTGQIGAAQASVLCPEAASAGGMVTVSDTLGNSTHKSFTIEACRDGQS
jgi:hypothetical protein